MMQNAHPYPPFAGYQVIPGTGMPVEIPRANYDRFDALPGGSITVILKNGTMVHQCIQTNPSVLNALFELPEHPMVINTVACTINVLPPGAFSELTPDTPNDVISNEQYHTIIHFVAIYMMVAKLTDVKRIGTLDSQNGVPDAACSIATHFWRYAGHFVQPHMRHAAPWLKPTSFSEDSVYRAFLKLCKDLKSAFTGLKELSSSATGPSASGQKPVQFPCMQFSEYILLNDDAFKGAEFLHFGKLLSSICSQKTYVARNSVPLPSNSILGLLYTIASPWTIASWFCAMQIEHIRQGFPKFTKAELMKAVRELADQFKTTLTAHQGMNFAVTHVCVYDAKFVATTLPDTLTMCSEKIIDEVLNPKYGLPSEPLPNLDWYYGCVTVHLKYVSDHFYDLRTKKLLSDGDNINSAAHRQKCPYSFDVMRKHNTAHCMNVILHNPQDSPDDNPPASRAKRGRDADSASDTSVYDNRGGARRYRDSSHGSGQNFQRRSQTRHDSRQDNRGSRFSKGNKFHGGGGRGSGNNSNSNNNGTRGGNQKREGSADKSRSDKK